MATVALLLAGGLLSLAETSRVVSAYTPHAPIEIRSDVDFTPANGVTSGSGTPSDPYVIEGWEVDASSSVGIRVQSTRSHFVIRAVYIHSGFARGWSGVFLYDVTNGSVEDAAFVDDYSAVVTYYARNVTVARTNASGNGIGLSVSDSTNVTIEGNSVNSSRYEGIYVFRSSDVRIVANDVVGSGGGGGIVVGMSQGLNVSDNRIESNADFGLSVYHTTNVTAHGNRFVRDGVGLWGSAVEHYASHALTTDNLVNGLPLRYYRDLDGLSVDGLPTGELIVANSTRVRVANISIAGSDFGMIVGFVRDSVFADNNVSSNDMGGVDVWYSGNLSLTRNVVSSNGAGASGTRGITVLRSRGIVLSDNRLAANSAGAYLFDSADVTVTRNNVSGGQPGIYWQNVTGAIRDNRFSMNWRAVHVYQSLGVEISGNNMSSDNSVALLLRNSWDILVEANTIANAWKGIDLDVTGGARVFHNTLVSNTIQAEDLAGSENAWNDTYPSGGNYWSDYGGSDDCSGPDQDVCPDPDGIGDTPYAIDADSRDRYPLMTPYLLGSGRAPAAPVMRPAELVGAGLENVRISWNASRDDGGGEGDVARYEIWHGTAYDPTATLYTLLAVVSPGTREHSHSGAGVGDPSDYFYQVRAVENDTGRFTAAREQAAKISRPLRAGPNLLSVPLDQANWSVASVLQMVPWTRARAYDAVRQDWSVTDRRIASPEPVVLDRVVGVWVNLTANATWAIAGLVPRETLVSLAPGWNLIGCPCFRQRTVAELFGGVGYEDLEGFAPVAPYFLRRLAPSDPTSAGEAYWILVPSAATLAVTN